MDTDPTNGLSVLGFTRMETRFGTNCWEVVWTNTEPPYEVWTNIECEVVGHASYWPSSTARVYGVQWTPELESEPWRDLEGMTNLRPQGAELSITNPVVDAERIRHYRLRVTMP